MTTNATSGQESDASPADQHPTNEADGETVHSAGEWRLVVRADGAVEARTHWPNGDPKTFTTASKQEAPEPSATYRYGKSIEKVLARYAHETRFERDTDEHGAALRRSIIAALQSVATGAVCGRSECGDHATHVRHVNAPTGPKTTVVCDEHATDGRYVTNHPLGNDRMQEGDR